MTNDDRDLEQLEIVTSQVLGRLADNAPEAVAHVLDGMTPEQRREAEHAIAHGRWNNKRG